MGGTGWSNPFPLEFGGGPTPIENVYRMLKSAIGKGGISTNDEDESLEALWRQSKAKGIGLANDLDERAAEQAFPDKATDLLPYYERTLMTQPAPGASREERQSLVARRWTQAVAFLTAEIESALQEIDSRFSVLLTTDEDAAKTVFGRNFEDLAGSEPYGDARRHTLYPYFSSYYLVTALLDNGGTVPTAAEARSILAAKDHLASVLSAWQSFQVVTAVGFNLDEDHLDQATLVP